MSNELLSEPAVEPLLDDDGHGVIEDLDQGTARTNEKLGHLDRSTSKACRAPKEPFQGFKEERGREVQRPGLQCYRHRGSPGLCLPIHRWTCTWGEIILINVPAAQNELLFEPGVANLKG